MLSRLRSGDVLVIWKLDRLGRSLTHLVSFTNELMARQIGFISLNDPIDTTTAQGRLVFNIFASLAEFERDLIRERTQAGLKAARARGRKGGRPKGITKEAKAKAMAAETLYREGTLTVKEICAQPHAPRRIVMATGFLTAAERVRLNTYPEDLASGDLGRFFTLTPQDLALVEQQRGDHNRLGFALQLSTLRYLGFIPENLLDGARSTNQQLQRSAPLRRYPLLIAFLKQALTELTDVVVDLFDACLWQRHADAKQELDQLRLRAARSTNEKLRIYSELTKIVVNGEVPDAAVRMQVFERFSSDRLQQLIEETDHLIRPPNDEALDLFAQRYSYFRQFSPTFLATLTFRSHRQGDPLIQAVELLKQLNASGKRAVPIDAPTAFIADAWWAYVSEQNGHLNRRYYELAVLWELRLALRAGDVFVEHARRYADPNTYLIPHQIWPAQRPEVIRLTLTPPSGETRLQEREAELQTLSERVERLHAEKNSWLRTEKGKWVLTPPEGEERPASATALEEAIADRLPRLDITDLLIEVDRWTGFSRHFFQTAPGAVNQNEQEMKHLYASLLAQACNFSLAQMSRTSGLAYHQLVYMSTWHLREETLKAANTELVNYHHGLEVSQRWGAGTVSSSDGQRLPVSGKQRQARSILRYFGYRSGVTFYTWTSDQFSLYGGKAVTTTVRDATYVLDEILANETELPILEHTTDTSGYTEIVFALFDLLGLTFTPRIKDLADQQLYRTDAFDLSRCPTVRVRLSKRLSSPLILEMWDEMLRLAGSLKLSWATASLVIQKLHASARKSELAKALQEYGRLIKTLHALSWYESEEKRRWANRQLNKGEAVHSLKVYLSVGNRGMLRRKTDEGLQHQVGCLNLVTNAVILWNSVYMDAALKHLEQEGYAVNPDDLNHVWPTRGEYVNVYGKYEFNLTEARLRNGLRELRLPDALNP